MKLNTIFITVEEWIKDKSLAMKQSDLIKKNFSSALNYYYYNYSISPTTFKAKSLNTKH